MSTALSTHPMPELEPLQLLYVTNGSPLTADRWWQAHHYYQHRQNLHYQSLYQPGIVWGLGVRVIPAPETVPVELRDDRWLEIQPGIAIDLVGNPIVVEEPIPFRVTSEVLEESVSVYVVMAYVNPRAKQWSGMPADIVKEEFRINERTTPPDPQEVELCRIQLTSNAAPLQNAAQVLAPVPHEVDLRYRQRVQARSPQPVQVGLVSQQPDAPFRDRLTALLQAVSALYPPLSSATTITPVVLTNPGPLDSQAPIATGNHLSDLTVLFLPYEAAIALTKAEIESLQHYLAQGSTLLIEHAGKQDHAPPLIELQAVQAELLAALADLQAVEAGTELASMNRDLTAELAACETAFQDQLQAIAHPIQQLAQTLMGEGATADPIQTVSGLTSVPFLFDELPQLPTGPIHLMAWDGGVLVVGSLSAAWTRQQFEQPLPRSTLRSAQELGINILYHASRRQQMYQAQRVRQ